MENPLDKISSGSGEASLEIKLLICGMNLKANMITAILNIAATLEISLKLSGRTPKKLDVVMLAMEKNVMEFVPIIQLETI